MILDQLSKLFLGHSRVIGWLNILPIKVHFLVVLWVVLAHQLLHQEELVVLTYVHMDFIDQPTQELVGVVVGVIVEKLVTCSYPRDKASMIDDPSISLGCRYALEQVLQLINQVIFLCVRGLPLQNLLSEHLAVKQHLQC